MIHRASLRTPLFAAAAVLLASGCAKTSGDGSDGDGGSASSGGSACGSKQDAEGTPIVVRFVNERPEEIYLWTDCDVPDRPSFVLSRDGETVKIDKPTCSGTCGQAQTDEEPYCPTVDCERGKLLRVEAGATYEYAWQAAELVLSSMPDDCYHASKTIQSSCWRQVDLPESTFVAGGELYIKQQLQESGAPPMQDGCPCALPADTDGVCEIDRDFCSVEGTGVALPQVTVDLPSAGAIDFVITAAGS